jgi:hypothetical protein
LVLTHGIEGAPAAVVILVAIWLVWSCSILLRRALQFVAGRLTINPAAGSSQPSIRREPTFPPSVRSRGSAELAELSVTIEALQLRVAALEQQLQERARISVQPARRMRHREDRTAVPLDWTAALKRKIDLG